MVFSLFESDTVNNITERVAPEGISAEKKGQIISELEELMCVANRKTRSTYKYHAY